MCWNQQDREEPARRRGQHKGGHRPKAGPGETNPSGPFPGPRAQGPGATGGKSGIVSAPNTADPYATEHAGVKPLRR